VGTSATTITMVYIMICAGTFVARRRSPTQLRPYRIPGGIVVPVAATILSCGMLVTSIGSLIVDIHSVGTIEASVLLFWTCLGGLLWSRYGSGASQRLGPLK